PVLRIGLEVARHTGAYGAAERPTGAMDSHAGEHRCLTGRWRRLSVSDLLDAEIRIGGPLADPAAQDGLRRLERREHDHDALRNDLRPPYAARRHRQIA